MTKVYISDDQLHQYAMETGLAWDEMIDDPTVIENLITKYVAEDQRVFGTIRVRARNQVVISLRRLYDAALKEAS